MRALVVYESLWGNTARIARAIAEGIGPDARAVPADEATPEALDGVDLLVAGAPLLGFSLPTEEMRENIKRQPGSASSPPDLSHPSIRSWLQTVPAGSAKAAGFETRIWWSPGSAAKSIAEALGTAGYATLGTEKFVVKGRYGPLKDGEVERARAWGAELAKRVG